MKKHLLIAGLFAASLLTACEKEAEKEDSASKFIEITAPFLTASDFAKGSGDQTTAADITAKLLNADELWDNHPESSSGGSSGGSSSCMDNFKIRVVGTNKVVIGGSDDVTSCIQGNYEGSGFSLSSVAVKYYTEIECSGVDITGLDGQAVSDANMSTLAATCGQADLSTLMQMDMTMVGTYTYMGQSFSIDSNVKSASMNPDGTGCTQTFSNSDWTGVACTEYNKITSASSGESSTDLIIMDFHNLVKTEGSTAPFYKSGSVDIHLNGWEGTVTYNGPNANASYSITDGTTTKSGSLTTGGAVTSSSLKLVEQKMKSEVLNIKKLILPKLN